ncbi:unnamed protein product [Cladocopium goreaui]|uniref:Pumilio domain-containing protein NOP9 n=1 Tax=Cladocopium goreaui TaxID=2562237 RepID=A0A9P1BU26_9DINO|nr:unnamed protein product [Cladocopium goreaui]
MARWQHNTHHGRHTRKSFAQRKAKRKGSADSVKTSQSGGAFGGEKRRPIADLVDYVRSCSKALDGLSKTEENLLSSRALEEATAAPDRLFSIASDQRGSKPLEKLIKKATPEVFSLIFKMLLEAFGDLATNQYASHVLETALRSWADRLGNDKPSLHHCQPLVTACSRLNDEALWPSLAINPCSAHVLRALLMALGGYAHEEGKEKLAARAGLLPQTKHPIPSEIAECRRKSAASLVKLIKQDNTNDFNSPNSPSLCLNAHASPIIQLLLRLLRDCGDRALLSEACAAVVGAKAVNGSPSVERCDALMASAAGSRVLEAVLETAGAELFAELFSRYFRSRLCDLATATSTEFGPFIAQKVADALREGPQLQLALNELDFVACLGSGSQNAQHMVVLKFLEASLRLRAALKQAAGGVFRALALHASSEYHRAWSSLLSLAPLDVNSLIEGEWMSKSERKSEKTNSKTDGKDTKLKAKKGKKFKGMEKGVHSGEDKKENPETEAGEAESVGSPKLRRLPAAGAMLLAVLLRFPAETVAPIVSGLSKILRKDILLALALESRTARVLEAALAPSSALGMRRLKLAASFKGLMATLGPHHIGGWVCAALWRTSLGDSGLRQAFAKELLDVEEKLRADNFAVWKVCGLHQVKVHTAEWMQQQKKAGKVQALFGDLIEGDTESARAAKMRKVRAAEDEALAKAATEAMEDPTVAALLPCEPMEESPALATIEVSQSKSKADSGDQSLQETLQLIKGKASRKKRKRAREIAEEEPE